MLVHLNRGRICLALPVKRTIEQLKDNPLMVSSSLTIPLLVLISLSESLFHSLSLYIALSPSPYIPVPIYLHPFLSLYLSLFFPHPSLPISLSLSLSVSHLCNISITSLDHITIPQYMNIIQLCL